MGGSFGQEVSALTHGRLRRADFAWRAEADDDFAPERGARNFGSYACGMLVLLMGRCPGSIIAVYLPPSAACFSLPPAVAKNSSLTTATAEATRISECSEGR
jgi:hypothetical protein